MNRTLVVALVVIGAAFGAVGTWLAERVAPGELSGADRARIEHTVRDYILANPDIIPEAMQRLNDRENAKVIATMRSAIETPYGNAYMGNPKGDVTLVEYYDYNCGYCRASLPTLDKLVQADPKLRIVFREMPVLVEAQRRLPQVRFVFVNQGEDAATVADYLRDEGLAPRHVLIDGNHDLSTRFGVRGYPTTLFLGADGTVRDRAMGELSRATLAERLRRIASQPAGTALNPPGAASPRY